ncbi:hypothetical protein [Methylobacterium marchantiae]|uniref:Flagellar hook-associated protein 2 N-terminal domain-containing protein n=1 Tax=Methylobacterium marchantiae TaxID=600331 RepID=A0ABW3X3Q9_9HYPH|nr:hypothetical protein AIGOOFII_3455 [Methylobacterium marchantiae]
MSDSPTPGVTGSLDTLSSLVGAEVSNQAGRLMRLQNLQSRALDAKAAYSKLMQEISDIQVVYHAEMGAYVPVAAS